MGAQHQRERETGNGERDQPGWLPFRVTPTALWPLLLGLVVAPPAAAQDSAQVRLDVTLSEPSPTSGTRDPVIYTRNLFTDTPWLASLRQGLGMRLSFRLEVWRSREGWFDELDRQLEWTVIIRHEPLLDQYSVVTLLPKEIRQNRYGTAGALAAVMGKGVQLKLAPSAEGSYYYASSLAVSTLSDSDLSELERTLRGELGPGEGQGQSLAQRARRLLLRLAGLPEINRSGRSEMFEVRGK